MPNSAVALAISQVARDQNKAMLASGPGTDALTGAQCSTNTIQWTYDTYEIGHAAAHAIMQRGGKTWFFITADYTFGHDLQNQASDEIVNEGGKILGAAAHPLGANDFSSFLLQAQVSGAQVIALANAGADETNALKQAGEFALTTDHTVVGLIFGLQNVPPLGLAVTQGLLTVQAWYWDLKDNTRAFARRYQARMSKHEMPNDMQAGHLYRGAALSQGS